MKFIHAADLHIDSPLAGLSSHPDATVELLRMATRSAFDGLIEQAVREDVDFVVFPGDIYDGDWNDFNTGYYFNRQMLKLRDAGIPVYVWLKWRQSREAIVPAVPVASNGAAPAVRKEPRVPAGVH